MLKMTPEKNNAQFLATSRALRMIGLIQKDFQEVSLDDIWTGENLRAVVNALHTYRKQLNGWDPEEES